MTEFKWFAILFKFDVFVIVELEVVGPRANPKARSLKVPEKHQSKGAISQSDGTTANQN